MLPWPLVLVLCFLVNELVLVELRIPAWHIGWIPDRSRQKMFDIVLPARGNSKLRPINMQKLQKRSFPDDWLELSRGHYDFSDHDDA